MTRNAPTAMSQAAAGAPRVPKRVAAVILNSLKGGVVPRIGLPYITVGREAEIRALLTDLSLIADGGCELPLPRGPLRQRQELPAPNDSHTRHGRGLRSRGCGRSRRSAACRAGRARASPPTASSSATSPPRLVPRAGRSASCSIDGSPPRYPPRQPTAGYPARPPVLHRMQPPPAQTLPRPQSGDRCRASAHGRAADEVLNQTLAPLEELVHGFDFTRMLRAYRSASIEGDDERKSYVLKWLRGEYRTKTEARAELGCSTIIGDDDWYDYVKLFAAFLTGAGYKGLLVLIDELVNLFKIPTASRASTTTRRSSPCTTTRCRARHATWGSSWAARRSPSRTAGAASFPTRRCARASRRGRFAAEGMRDMLAPIIHLHPLTYEELLVLIEKLQQIHAGYFGYEARLSEGNLVQFLQIEFGRVGADTHLTPREVIRDFIELLDIAFQNPDTPVASILGSVGDSGGSGLAEHSGGTQPSGGSALVTPADSGRDASEFAEFKI